MTHSWNVTFSEAVRQARAGAGGGEGSDINIFPRRSISLVRRNGCLPAPCGRESPSGQKQIKAHTLQIGGLPQLARRREFSAALIEKSLSLLLPIFLLPCFKRKSHPLPTLASHLPLSHCPAVVEGVGPWLGTGPALGRSGGGGLCALASITPSHPSR